MLKDGAKSSLPTGMPSFQALYTQYFDFVWASTRRLGVAADAIDDVVQEVFIVIHSRLHTLQQPEALRSWIYGVVRRTVSTHHRAQRARGSGRLTADGHELQSKEPNPFEVAQKNSELQLLSTLLGSLDEAKREVFMLVELDELTVPEAAVVLDVPLNTAYSRLRAARQAFEAALARHEARAKPK